MHNIFELPNLLPLINEQELINVLLDKQFNDTHLYIERIVSTGQKSAENFWYNQNYNEWVILLKGKAGLLIENSSELHLKAGDYIFIPAHTRHKVTYTDTQLTCVWLAIFFK